MPAGALQVAQTSLATRRMHVVAELYVGPAHGRSLWAATREAITTLGRPIARWLRLPAAFVEGFRFGAAAAKVNELLRPMVRSTYHRDDLDVVASDPDVDQAFRVLLAQSLRLIQAAPAIAHASREPQVFPAAVTRDDTVSTRVAQAGRLLEELNIAVRKHPTDILGLGRADPPSTEPCPWAYDPSVPTAIARRLMAGRRATFAPLFVWSARGTWSIEAQRQAALDWADDVIDIVGLAAGALPGLAIPSLPTSAVVDFDGIMKEHAEVLAAREAHITAAFDAINAD